MILTREEQDNVRFALRALRVSNGGLALLAARMECSYTSLEKASFSARPVGALMAFRVAHFAGVAVDDVLSGRWPGREFCRHCGHPVSGATSEEPGDAH